jgi:hypothetical protein
VDGTGSGRCPVADFSIRGVISSGYCTRKLLTSSVIYLAGRSMNQSDNQSR